MDSYTLSGSNDYAGDIDDTIASKEPPKDPKKTNSKKTPSMSKCPQSNAKESDSDQWVTDNSSDEGDSKQSEKAKYDERKWESLRKEAKKLNINTNEKKCLGVLTAEKKRKPGSWAANWKPKPKPNATSGSQNYGTVPKQFPRKSFEDDDESDACWFCGKEDPSNKRCSRCYSAMYCSQDCQKSDFKSHKPMCKRKGRFDAAFQKHHPDAMQPLFKHLYIIFPDYGDYEFFDEDLTNGEAIMKPLIAEIVVGSFFHPWRHGGNIMDINGEVLILCFYTDSQVFRRKQKRRGKKGSTKMETIPLDKCLVPGNFVIIFQPMRQCFLDGSTGFRIEDDAEVDFIFT